MFKFSPETPPDSGIRRNNVLIFFRKAGNAVLTPFLFLGILVVTILAAQSLQLRMVVGHNNLLIVRISRLTLLSNFHVVLVENTVVNVFRRFSWCES